VRGRGAMGSARSPGAASAKFGDQGGRSTTECGEFRRPVFDPLAGLCTNYVRAVYRPAVRGINPRKSKNLAWKRGGPRCSGRERSRRKQRRSFQCHGTTFPGLPPAPPSPSAPSSRPTSASAGFRPGARLRTPPALASHRPSASASHQPLPQSSQRAGPGGRGCLRRPPSSSPSACNQVRRREN